METARIWIKDKDPANSRRRYLLWKCIGAAQIKGVQKIECGRAAFYVIGDDEALEKFMSPETRTIFQDQELEIQDPPEYNAKKTIVVKGVDTQVSEYSPDDIVKSVERENEWAKVAQVIKLPNTTTMLKIKFETAQMAKKALDSGFYILFQYITPFFVEK